MAFHHRVRGDGAGDDRLAPAIARHAAEDRDADARRHEPEDARQAGCLLRHGHDAPMALERVDDDPAEGRPLEARSHDEVLARQLVDGDGRFGGERMLRRQQRHQAVARDGTGLDLRALEVSVEEAEVDLVLEDAVALHGRGHVGHLKPDLRIGATELAHDVRHQRMAADRGVADAQDGLGARGEQPHRVVGRLDTGEDRLRLLQKIAAGFGQPHAARGALQQFHAQPFLQLQHDAAHRRLGHGQALRGPVKVQFLSNGDEGGQMLQIVAHTDAAFISIRDKIIISQPACRCLRIISNRKRAASTDIPEWINGLRSASQKLSVRARAAATAIGLALFPGVAGRCAGPHGEVAP